MIYSERAQGFTDIFRCLQAQISQAVPGSGIAMLWQYKQSRAVDTKSFRSFAGCLEVAALRFFLMLNLNARFLKKCKQYMLTYVEMPIHYF